jgi:hypothetical protein
MPNGRDRLPDNKKEEQGHLAKVVSLAPLLSLILQILELTLKILGVTN